MRYTIDKFSCKSVYLRCPLSRGLAVLSDFSLPTSFNRLFRQTAALSLLRLRVAPAGSTGILTCSAIGLAVRLTLRTRLTLIRLTLFRNPWVYGVNISIFIIVTYAYIFFSRRSSIPHGTPSTLTGMLPYHATQRRVLSFGGSFDARSSSTHHRSTSELLRTL